MAEHKDLTVGLIGTGGIMGWHIGNLKKVHGVTVGAMTDPSTEMIAKTKKANPDLANASEFACHKEMLAQSRLDAVIICSPHADHYAQIIDALNAGCHVLVEKPFVASVAQAKKCIALARNKKKTLMISYQRHFDPKFRFMRNVVQSGRIGTVQQVSSSLGQDWLNGTRGSWRQDPKKSCGGQLNDSGSHVVDIALWITGLKPKEVYANLNFCGSKVDINSAVSVKLEKDAVWTINVGGNTPGFWEYLIIAGDKGALFYENGNLSMVEGKHRMKIEGVGNYHDQTAGFFRAIRGQTPNEVPGEFGMLVTALTQSAFKSAATKKPVRISL